MPWNQSGGGGWKGGPSGGPWGQGPAGGGSPPPDLEEILRRSQDKLRQAVPGGVGFAGIGLLLFVLAAAVGYFGFTVRINPDERGVVQRFGAYDRELSNGLNFRWPYPVEEVTIVPFTRQNRVEVGFSSGPTGPFGAIRSSARNEESLMLTGDENIVELNFNVFWNVKDAPAYLFNVRNQGDSLDASPNVKAVAESAMREVIGQNDIQPILTKSRQDIEESVKTLIQRTLDSYKSGINITQVNLQKVDPPSEVIAAFRDVQAARADQERLRNEAESYANRVVPEARGEAQRILQGAQGYREQAVAEAKGRTERFLKVFEEYQKAPDVTRKRMYLETLERVLGGMDKIIIDEKSGTNGVVPYLPLNELQRTQTGGQR
ncbi:FtsH protease activity modulator HflK [Rhodomicrobium lacus]|jgi:membrane protease subunit HflK|uniref:FtsH protease activity modulator HflK n=1 Tax=Rhodomicrobium lacus TaxID=2498452 RepID=UPI000F8C6FC2|nr:FtsH protease activity modulator HflK [Rhodomicrobium lacus]WKW51529.1 FtsH protease activity modulator HflK [Rhodomicrobium lacus]